MDHSIWIFIPLHTFLTEEAMLANIVPGWLGVGERGRGERTGCGCWMSSRNMICLEEDIFMKPIIPPSKCVPAYFKTFRCMWGFTSLLTVRQGFHWRRDRLNHAISLLSLMYLTPCLSIKSQSLWTHENWSCGLMFGLVWFFFVLGIKPRSSLMLGNCSTTNLHHSM